MIGSRPLSDAEIDLTMRTFFGKYASRDKALFLVGIKTGFRISELLSLRIADVLTSSGDITDRLVVRRRNMKRKVSSRSVIFHEDAKAAILPWLDQLRGMGYTNDDYLFQSRSRGNKSISRQQAWAILRDAFMANNLEGTLGTHTMRKSFASHVYDQLEGNIFKVCVALGHKSPSSTMSYLSFKQDEIDDAIRA